MPKKDKKEEKFVSAEDAYLESINKMFGPLPPFGEHYLTTGIKLLDYVMSGRLTAEGELVGGWPLGQFVMFRGPQSAGKTTFLNKAIQAAQAYGGIGEIYDMERKYNRPYAQKCGVNVGRMSFPEVNNTEDIIAALELAVRTYTTKGSINPWVLGWDSIANTCTRAHDEPKIYPGHKTKVGIDMSKWDKRKVSDQANVNSGFFARNTMRDLAKTNILFIGINQVRASFQPYGPEFSTPGGNILMHDAIIILDFKAKLTYKEKKLVDVPFDKLPGHFIEISFYKNQLAPPGRKIAIPHWYSHGPDDCLTTLYYLMEHGKLEYYRGWFKLNGRSHHLMELRDLMYSDDSVRNYIEDVMRETFISQM